MSTRGPSRSANDWATIESVSSRVARPEDGCGAGSNRDEAPDPVDVAQALAAASRPRESPTTRLRMVRVSDWVACIQLGIHLSNCARGNFSAHRLYAFLAKNVAGGSPPSI